MLFNEPVGFKNNCGVKTTLESIAYYPYHVHDSILEVICVLDGRYEISSDAHDHMLAYGDVYYFNPGNAHKLKKADDNCILLTVHIDLPHYDKYFKNFDGSGCYSLIDDFFICDSFRHENKYSLNEKHLRFLMAKLYREYSAGASEHTLEALVVEFLNHSLHHYRNYFYAGLSNGNYVIIQQNNHSIGDGRDDRIYRIIDYIYDHYHEKITLEDVASLEHLNASYLSAYIRKASGLSFSNLVSIARCEAAEQLLCSTAKNLDETARDVGFANRNLLTNQFRKWFHKTPSKYRKEILADLSAESAIQFDNFNYDFAILILESYLDGY